MTCKFCKKRNGGIKGICDDCRKKQLSLRTHRVFRTDEEAERAKLASERKPQSRLISFEPPDTYKHKLGSETKKLIDFVNKSGTIHYGRYVAGMIGKER